MTSREIDTLSSQIHECHYPTCSCSVDTLNKMKSQVLNLMGKVNNQSELRGLTFDINKIDTCLKKMHKQQRRARTKFFTTLFIVTLATVTFLVSKYVITPHFVDEKDTFKTWRLSTILTLAVVVFALIVITVWWLW